MAATNFTPIILYHTTTASATPSAGNLNNGELAINITDGKLFYKDNGGTVQVIATKGTGTIGGSTTQVQYNNAGSLAGSANFTFNGTTATINTLNLTNALGTTHGGTGLNAYTTGDLVYASGTNTLAKLGIGLNTYILTSTGSVPQWSAPSAVTVATANNLAGGAAGSVPYQSGASTTTFLSIGTSGQILSSTGSAPQWSSPAALTKTDDTNVTLTLGGSASTALVNAASLTLGWTGQLSIARGGTNATATPTAGAVAYGTGTAYAFTAAGTSGQVLTSNGAGVPTWASLSSIGVTTFSAGTTGFTPSTATSGAITLAGTLATTNGGTGLTSFTANRVFYSSSTSAIGQSANLTFDGTTLVAANFTDSSLTSGRVTYATTGGNLTDSANLLYSGTDLTVYGITVGRGAGAIATNTAVGASALAANTTGAFNSAVGTSALAATTTGSYNTALGRTALTNNTTGGENTGLGANALQSNTTGGNNIAVGGYSLVTNSTGNYNTAVGWGSLWFNTTASNNTAVGYQAGYSNTTGSGLVAVGYQAGFANTTGLWNTAVGYLALDANTTGQGNTVVGTETMGANTTASNNTAMGFGALNANTTGTLNTAIGGGIVGSVYGAMALNTTGSSNTAVGNQALYSNTTANNNTAVGYQAAYACTTGTVTAFGAFAAAASTTANAITAIGPAALRTNTTGGYNTAVGSGDATQYAPMYFNTTGSHNIAMGTQALYQNTTGSSNTAIGRDALQANTTASNNTAVGYQALYSNTTAADNTALGLQAGYSNTTGSNNVFVGNQAGFSITTGFRNTFIGGNNGNAAYGAGGYITTGSRNTIIGGYNGNQGGLDIRTASNYIVLSDGDGNPRIINNGAQTLLGAVAGVVSGRLEVTGDTANQYPALVGIGKGDITNQVGQQLVLIDSDNTQLRANFIVEDTGARGGLFIQATEVGLTNDRDLYLAAAGGIITVGGRSPDTSGGAIQLQGTTYGGITFPATQVASSQANTLDDYEEGTWTPNVTIGGSSTGITYSARAGTYTKVGNLVQISFIIRLTSRGSQTGDVAIDGLPFIKANNAVDFGHAYVGTLANMAALNSTPFGGIPGNTATIAVRQLDSASAGTTDPQITQANISNSWIFGMTAVYTTST